MTDDLDMALDTPHKIGTQVADELTAAAIQLKERLRNDRMWLMGKHQSLIQQLDLLTEVIARAKEAAQCAGKLDSFSGKSEMDLLRERAEKAENELKRFKERRYPHPEMVYR